MVQEKSSTPRIYGALDGQQEDHHATMVEIEGKVSNTSISILIDYGACRGLEPSQAGFMFVSLH